MLLKRSNYNLYNMAHTETDADEIAEPCAFRRSETEHTVSTQTRRRRMNTRNDRICLNPNEYYTKTTI